MINLCILEDNLIEASIVENLILVWGKEKSKAINIYLVNSIEEFCNLVEKFSTFDGFFLDIELPDGNGMAAASKIRDLGYKTPLAFITSNDTFVFDGYDVSAIKYVLKPINQLAINNLMDKLYYTLPDKIYSFESHGITYALKYNDIIYFESHGHYIDIVTINDSYKQRKNISFLTKELMEDFCQSYRTIIINMKYVKTIQNSWVILINGNSLPLGKKFANDFKKAYFKFQLSH